jgi:membrane-associated phospholipid phosphatase
MDQIVTSADTVRDALHDPKGLWPVDWLTLAYLTAAGVLVLAGWRRLPDAGWLLALHAGGAALLVGAARSPASRLVRIFRHWYPLPYVVACYKEMSLLIPALRGVDFDPQMVRLDYAIWGAHPNLWLERWQQPLLTETLQILYSLFVPAIMLVACLLWRQRRRAEFRYYAFLLALGFLVSYVGYFLVPVRGPRFLLSYLQRVPLVGLFSFGALRRTLDVMESAHYDCFPSGHVELTIIACWSSRMISSVLFRIFFAYTLCVGFATVYLRYHYTVDVMAGALVAAALLAIAPRLYAALERGC